MTRTAPVLAPRTPLEASEVARDAAARGLRLAFAGGGTHRAPRADVPDAIVSTSAMCGIVEYAAEDQTVTVEAGMTLGALGRALAKNDQRLVVEVTEPERATVGGAIAANAYGPRRMRYGSLKDLILGVTLVRADGTRARAGGKVVKNVAGFDLSKLVVGSYGTLALVTTATLRVHPRPERARAVRASGLPAEAVWSSVLALRARQLEPAALSAVRRPDGPPGYTFDVLFEGFAAGVDAQVDALSAPAAVPPAQEVDPAIALEADRSVRAGGPLRVRCTARPSAFGQTDRDVVAPLLAMLDAAAAVVYPSLGVTFVSGRPRDAAAVSVALGRARTVLERLGGSLVLEAIPDVAAESFAALETWGTPPPAFELMRQLKARFDPHARLNPGCFVGGL